MRPRDRGAVAGEVDDAHASATRTETTVSVPATSGPRNLAARRSNAGSRANVHPGRLHLGLETPLRGAPVHARHQITSRRNSRRAAPAGLSRQLTKACSNASAIGRRSPSPRDIVGFENANRSGRRDLMRRGAAVWRWRTIHAPFAMK